MMNKKHPAKPVLTVLLLLFTLAVAAIAVGCDKNEAEHEPTEDEIFADIISNTDFLDETGFETEDEKPIEEYVSSTLSDFRYAILEDGSAEITGYTGKDSLVAVPPEIDGYKVTTIAKAAFSGNHELNTVQLPNSITTIAALSFNSSSIVELICGSGLESIGARSFYGCQQLQRVNFPSSLKKIGDEAFSFCTSLEEVIIPENVIDIGTRAFSRCRSLTRLYTGDSLTGIEIECFYGCVALKNLSFGQNLNYISNKAFSYCTSLGALNLPDSLDFISRYAFQSCSSLCSVVIPESVTYIGYRAFDDCDTRFVVYGADGSEAETYARLDGLKFEAI